MNGDSSDCSEVQGESSVESWSSAQSRDAPLGPGIQSPSLEHRRDSGQPAHEMKFLLDEQTARAVERHLQGQLTPDPHSQSSGYQLTTLYLDTPELDVLNRRGRHRFFKLRLRRYGNDETLFLERKAKQGLQVRKRRSTISLHELPHLAAKAEVRSWAADWYQSQVVRSRLRPVCLLHYDRNAYFAADDSGPLRLTFDRNVSGVLVQKWSLTLPPQMSPLLPDQVVCEFKYRGALPHLFKSMIEALRLLPVSVSKYRHCWRVAGGIEAHA